MRNLEQFLIITLFILLILPVVSCEEDDDSEQDDNFDAEYSDGGPGGDPDTDYLYEQCMGFYQTCFEFNQTQSDALCDDMFSITDPCLQYYYSRYWECMNTDVICFFEFSRYLGAELCTQQLWEEAAQSCD